MPVSTSTSSQQACTPLVKAKGYSLGDEVARLHQLARQVGRQRVAAEVDDAGELGERHARLARRPLDDLAVDEIERVGRRLQHGAGHLAARPPSRPCPACSAASPPMPAPRQAQVPPP